MGLEPEKILHNEQLDVATQKVAVKSLLDWHYTECIFFQIVYLQPSLAAHMEEHMPHNSSLPIHVQTVDAVAVAADIRAE